MAVFLKRDRDTAMRIICDFYASEWPDCFIEPEYLHQHGLPESVDAEQLIEVLQAMGYISYKRDLQGEIYNLGLTDAGKCYFERKADITHEKRIENIRYIITTAIAVAALITAIVSIILQCQ